MRRGRFLFTLFSYFSILAYLLSTLAYCAVSGSLILFSTLLILSNSNKLSRISYHWSHRPQWGWYSLHRHRPTRTVQFMLICALTLGGFTQYSLLTGGTLIYLSSSIPDLLGSKPSFPHFTIYTDISIYHYGHCSSSSKFTFHLSFIPSSSLSLVPHIYFP